jgi:hypothetical protein
MMMRYCEARAREGKAGVIGGFDRLEMGATLSGVALYEKCGYRRSGRVDVVGCGMPEGEGVRIVHMVKDFAEEMGEKNCGVIEAQEVSIGGERENDWSSV